MKLFQAILNKFNLLEEKSGGIIYPQLVKDIFNISTGQATIFLEMASRAGHLDKAYQVRCPTCKRIIATYNYKFQIPAELNCEAADDHQPFVKKNSSPLIQKVYLIHAH